MSLSTARFVMYLVCVGAAGAAGALLRAEPAWAWLSFAVSILGTLASFLETPPAARARVADLSAKVSSMKTTIASYVPPPPPPRAIGAMLLVGACALFAGSQNACTPAVQAEMGTLEQLVVQDLAAGKTSEQIEEDIVRTVCPSNVNTACVDGVVVLNDVLQGLIDLHVIPANLLPAAKRMLGEVHPQAVAHKLAAAQDGGAP